MSKPPEKLYVSPKESEVNFFAAIETKFPGAIEYTLSSSIQAHDRLVEKAKTYRRGLEKLVTACRKAVEDHRIAEVITCPEDCWSWDLDSATMEGEALLDALKAEIDRGTEVGWVIIKGGGPMPDDGESVLVCFEQNGGERYEVLKYEKRGDTHRWWDGQHFYHSPNKWMRIPK